MRTFLLPILIATLTCFAPSAYAAWESAPPDGNWVAFVVSLLLAVLVIGANMKNAKRGHQD